MAEKNSTSDQPNSLDVARYRANYLAEQEGIYLYSKLAEVESDAHLAELYRSLAGIEQRHSDLWKAQLTHAGEKPPTYASNWRIRTLLWIARRLGTGAVLSTVSSMEKRAMTDSLQAFSSLLIKVVLITLVVTFLAKLGDTSLYDA